MVASMLPFALLANWVMLGETYFGNGWVFLSATLLAFAFLCVGFLCYGIVAVLLRNRFPNEKQRTRRLTLTIGIFILLSALSMMLLPKLYESLQVWDYRFDDDHFWKLYIALVTVNIFLTFVHESVSYFEHYKATAIETEALKREYTRSQLLGLQSQVSPHFLFNNLNTLSSLIQENSVKAEEYLDELSKVYRYLLRTNEDQLVPLKTELAFVRSYYYLLRERHGCGLQLTIDVVHNQTDLLIPPMTLQMILENIISQNSISKTLPLQVRIESIEDNWLQVKNNVQPKVGSDLYGLDESLDNIINKIHLLCREEVSILTREEERIIQLPLILLEKEEAV